MRGSLILLPCFVLPALSQQIWDIWQTTWDRSKLFTSLAPSSPINFVTPGAIGSADIVINDGTVYQQIAGFGGSLTDSSATILNNLKTTNSANYWSLLQYMFTTTDGANAAGLNYIRIPIGASDFSANLYSLDDTSGDTSFNNFNINNIPSAVFSVLKDIQTTNSRIKIHILPWSPPGWMKDSGTMNGGSLQSQYISACRSRFQSKGFPVYAISIQNEPQNSNPTYPTCTMSADVEGQIGISLRSLLNSNGLSSVNIIGYEHNWDNAATYPVQLLRSTTHTHLKTIGSDWWSDINGTWIICETDTHPDSGNLVLNLTKTRWIGSLEYYSQSGLMWSIAADGNGNPKLPGTNSCGGNGCRPLVTVNSDGSYSFNQECVQSYHPKDSGGAYGQRIGVSVGGSESWALRVGAYVTSRLIDYLEPATGDNNHRIPRNAGNIYIPVGVTTLWWFAPNLGNARRSDNSTLSDSVKVTAANTAAFFNSTTGNFTRIKS
ncbi:glucan endo-1,6-beta-glucosidase [Pholiota molesta]|nr:glucan endo-1,6-beta-glucosidase [Pholiota molesta]